MSAERDRIRMSREGDRGLLIIAAETSDQIRAPFVERNFLALEAGIGKKTPQVFGARRLLTRGIDRIEADQFSSQIHGTCRHLSVPP